jgi:dethiobiotin synthetase
VFVTGTGTGVGKSVLAAAICAALAASGERVAAFKPVVTGLEEDPGEWGHDHELLASVTNAGQAPDAVAPYRFGPALSPHLAAEQAGVEIDSTRLVAAARGAAATAGCIVVEGVGGLMVPLTPSFTIRDLASDLALPLLIAARPGLGTINHSLLSIEAARAAGLGVAGVVMTPWTADPEPIEASNRDTVERLGRVRVRGLAPTSPSGLADAGAALPLSDWIA